MNKKIQWLIRIANNNNSLSLFTENFLYEYKIVIKKYVDVYQHPYIIERKIDVK